MGAADAGALHTPGMEPLALLRILLDPDRLAAVGLLALGPQTTADLAKAIGQQEKAVLRSIAPLMQAGLVLRADDAIVLDRQAWQAVARDLPQAPQPHPRIAFGMTPDEADLLGRFFVGERLAEIPSNRSKRLVVLERLALEFEAGRRYAEAEVSQILGRFHDDHASLRRHLVDEGLLDRDGGQYWRSGGRIV